MHVSTQIRVFLLPAALIAASAVAVITLATSAAIPAVPHAAQVGAGIADSAGLPGMGDDPHGNAHSLLRS